MRPRALDDYFARHATANDASGIGRTYVLRRGADDPIELPRVLGFHTLSMAATLVGCTGIIVDAKDADAQRFYRRYDFVEVMGDGWPRRMFLPIATAQAALAE